MLKHCKQFCHKVLFGRSKGVTMVEAVIAIVVLAVIVASVPPVFVLLAKAEFRWSEQTIAESLSRAQIEYIKGCPYIYGNATEPNPAYKTVPVPDDSYLINVTAQPIQIDPATRQHSDLPLGEDEGIQEITIDIYHVNKEIGVDKPVLSVINYKVDRP